MTVRRRRQSDLPGCVTALAQVHAVADHPYPLLWPGDPASWLAPPGLLAAWVVVLTSDDAVSGHVCLLGGGVVSRLFVTPAARGRGLGAGLLQTAAAHSRSQGRSAILQVVGDDGPAIALYERLGWNLTDRRPADWTTPDGNRPIIRDYSQPLAGSG